MPANFGIPSGWFNVKAYGAKGDGTTDDTVAIQASITACQGSTYGGIVYFPPGTYKVTGTTYALLVTGSNTYLLGAGSGNTTIAHASTTGDTVFFQKDATGVTRSENVGVEGIQFKPSVTKTAGNEINVFYSYNVQLCHLRFDGCYRCIQIGSTNNPSGDNYKFRPVFGYVSEIYAVNSIYFLLIQNATDWWFSNISAWLVGASGTNTLGGVTMDSNCESCNFMNCDWVGNSVSNSAALKLQSTLGFGTNAYNQFTNCYFDGFDFGVDAANTYIFTFTNCWFSDRTHDGVRLASTCGGFNFVGCQAYNCGRNGFNLDGFDHAVTNSQIHSMGISSTGDGIVVAATATGIRLQGNRISSGGSYPITGTTRYGINLISGSNDYIVTGNDTRGCGTGGINNPDGTSSTRIVTNNL
jgi:hypothetical protein